MSKVLLITIDALRYDHSLGDSDAEYMPFLNSLGSEGYVNHNAVSTGSGTSTSFPGILASSLPLDYGYRGLNSGHTTIQEVLKSNGISTIGISGNLATSRVFNYDRGFQYYRDTMGSGLERRVYKFVKDSKFEKAAKRIHRIKRTIQSKNNKNSYPVPYKKADEITNEFKNIINNMSGETDWFCWLHYMDPHNPYSPPLDKVKQYYDGDFDLYEVNKLVDRWSSERPSLYQGSNDNISDTELEALKGYYRAEVSFIDDNLSELVDWLDEQQGLDDVTLLICADHGEEFLDHGHYGHRPKLFDELIHVPFVFKDFSNTSHDEEIEVDGIISLLDLAPTITDLFNVERPNKWKGQSLLDKNYSRDEAISELSHRSGLGGNVDVEEAVISARSMKYKFIRNNQIGDQMAYDLISDPNETRDLYPEDPERFEELEKISKNRIEAIINRSVDESISGDVESRLEELGYIS